jgi:hypothetical protein
MPQAAGHTNPVEAPAARSSDGSAYDFTATSCRAANRGHGTRSNCRLAEDILDCQAALAQHGSAAITSSEVALPGEESRDST